MGQGQGGFMLDLMSFDELFWSAWAGRSAGTMPD